MRILVINGSPKKDKSDTMHITRAFLDGMNEVSLNEIHTIHAIDKHIEYCIGCFACMRNGGNCIHNDDMRSILEEILDSNLLIWSYPLYCYGMPAPLKALLDRTLPLSSMAMQKVGDRYEHIGQADFSHLKYVMICNGDYSCRLGNLLFFEAVRIACTVVLLMVASSAPCKVRHFFDISQDTATQNRVLLYQLELLVCELAVFIDDGVRDTDLSDVVKKTHHIDVC